MDSSIVKMCIYTNIENNADYIGYSAKRREGNKDVYFCEEKPGTFFKDEFYAIDPYFPTLPPGADTFYARDIDTDTYQTIEFGQNYDPFESEDNDVKFIAWNQPTPSTTPLYVYNRGNQYIFTFQQEDEKNLHNYTELPYSPIYVLTNPRKKHFTVKNMDGSNNTFPIVDDVPVFLFSGYQNRCLPNPNGMELGKCLALYVKNIRDPSYNTKQSSLLNHIALYDKHHKKNNFLILGIIITILIIFAIGIKLSLNKGKRKRK